MSTYRVVAPKVVAVVGGRRVHFDHGSTIPSGADQARLEHLLLLGLVVQIDPVKAPASARTKVKAVAATPSAEAE